MHPNILHSSMKKNQNIKLLIAKLLPFLSDFGKWDADVMSSSCQRNFAQIINDNLFGTTAATGGKAFEPYEGYGRLRRPISTMETLFLSGGDLRGLRTSMDVKIPQLRGRGSFFTEATRTFRETLVSSVEPSYAYDTEIDVVLYVIALAFRRSVTQYRNFDAKDKYKDLLITEKSDSKLLAKLHIRKLPISFALLKDSLDLPVFR
ncbi:hypothetical protein HPULCUR_011200 [Helicostylum pulchrum]|uniref:Uncharacterized protein n=1 Tax=Helicostylum pulchrum TaxID=562976 RepID=A0ABP9YFE2_9FUNG